MLLSLWYIVVNNPFDDIVVVMFWFEAKWNGGAETIEVSAMDNCLMWSVDEK